MSAAILIDLLAAQAPPGLGTVALHATGEHALRAAIAGGPVVTLQHPATPVEGAQRALSPYCFRCPIGLTFPSCEIACVSSLDEILAGLPGASVVIEPAAQVAGGMITAPPGHLRRVRDICDARGARLIADERATGAGTGGFFWAFTRDGIAPDLIVAGDTLTGRTHPIGATLSNTPIEPGSPAPGAIAAATDHVTKVTSGSFLGEARRKASNLTDAVAALAGHPRVADVRVRGLIAGIELDAGAAEAAAKIPHTTAAGNVLIIRPPLDIDDADLDAIPKAIIAALRQDAD